MDRRERLHYEILVALQRATEPMSSAALVQCLSHLSDTLHERTLRLHLSELDELGLTASLGKRGRVITEKGLEELRASYVLDRVGYLSTKIDSMTYSMSFDLATRTGTVIVNAAVVDAEALHECCSAICQVFERGLAMGNRLAIVGPGEKIGEVTIPAGKVGLCTVCSITLNGILLKHGVPTSSRFGGLLELHEGKPRRFVEILHYDGTSIDPLEVFIRGGMTNYSGAIRDGNGLIGASFRENPAGSRDMVVTLSERVSAIGLGAFVEIGWPDQPVLGQPVGAGRIGSIVIGGLNPVAILEETGHHVPSRAMAGLLEYNWLRSYEDLPGLIKQHRA